MMYNIATTSGSTIPYVVFELLRTKMEERREIIFRDIFGIKWRNPDNIVGGRLGFLFFLDRLYKRTSDPQVWNTLMEELGDIESHVLMYPTNNYTVFFGRLGLPFFYLYLYRSTGETVHLQKALKWADDYFKNISFRYNVVGSCSLFDGISGILLFALCLYEESQEEWLLEPIENYLDRILRQAYHGPRGVYWGGISNMERRNTGLGTGASGIAYVLCQAGKLFGNKLLFRVAEQALDQEDHTRIDGDDLSRNLSLSQGVAGIGWVRLRVGGLLGRPDYPDRWRRIVGDIGTWLDQYEGGEEELPAGIFTGCSGIGLAALDAFYQTGDRGSLKLAERIAAMLAGRVSKLEEADDDLLRELSDAGHLLLAMEDQKQGIVEGCYFLPEVTTARVKQDAWVGRPRLTGEDRKIRQVLFCRGFRLTSLLAEQQYPALMNQFLFPAENDQIPDFEAFVRKEMLPGREQSDDLRRKFERESFVMGIRRSPTVLHCRDETEELLDIQGLLIAGDERLLSTKLVLSDRIWIYSPDPPIALDARLSKKAFLEFYRNYGLGTHYYRINAVDDLEETVPAGISKFVLDRFITPETPAAACEKLKEFLRGQGPEHLELLGVMLQASDEESALKVVHGASLGEIRGYLMEGILQIAK